MGAGSSKDHYIQDAAESYIVYKLQELAVSKGVAISDDVSEKRNTFDNYCIRRNIEKDFSNSVYKHNVDAIVDKFFLDIFNKYQGMKFDFVDVEKEFRDKKQKGDFIIQFDNNTHVSISVKNYKNGFKQIQLCSGTWISFLNNFLFDPAGVGSFVNPFTNETFKGSNREIRNDLINKLGYGSLINMYDFLNETNDEIRQKYVKSEEARFWKNISSQWKNDCNYYGTKAAKKMSAALDLLSKDMVKTRVVHMAGLNYDEELLLIGKGKYLCSLTDKKYGEILQRVSNCDIKYSVIGQSLSFTLFDDKGSIVTIKIPFTLQKNGAWHLPPNVYSGTMYHSGEKVDLAYGERRPKKSGELSTSINTYLDLAKAGVCK